MSIARARELRASSTDAERLLWLKLRDRRLVGAKFRRQVEFPPYTVDFCCFEAKLIVEVDGSQHAERAKQDAVRTRRLEGDGFSVIRFWNNDVLTNTNGVLEAILTELNQRGAPFVTPLPRTRPEPERAKAQPRRRVMAARSSVPSPLVGEGQGEGAPASGTSTQPAHVHPIRVYFEDTDAGGMVYYANYLKFAERARTEMLRAGGINHAEMVAQDGLMLVVRRCTAEYHRSARLDDELAVETRVSALAGASILLDQVVRRGSEVLVEITVTIACVTKEGRATRLPERLRAAIAIN
ncbi:tol-pal system-associated acyl-CoA thioesterase [Dongia sp.]|uniref:tol-pal system-associated acyl-CoA thioesterase n=1 Tax=Dongia sp. TaxID=1977262 RepID=UPI0037537AC4